ncbi:MAG TPA: STAS domain-containing protein [Methylophilaceae bacterium]|jgi:anti-sigma B factor antagonist|nr:STAS domain-containing protein [Methylophilaceae bacterium]
MATRTNKSASSGYCRYAIEGEMTIYRANELKQDLLDKISGNQEIDIDLSSVTEIDSAGLQLMVLAKLEAVARNRVLRFDGHSKAVMEILDLSDLSGFFGDPVVISSAS